MDIAHVTSATGTDSADGKISKNAWNESHVVSGTDSVSGIAPWQLPIDVYTPHGNTNWSSTVAGVLNGLDIYSSGAQNDEIWWYLGVPGGTYDLVLWHPKFAASGIYSVRVDDVEVGTIDGYNVSTTHANKSTVSSVAIAAGKRKISLKMATKNGSSSNYFGEINALILNRTAGSDLITARAPGLATIALDPTYGDDFDGPALDAKWTRVNVTSGEETFADGYLDIAFGTGTAARSYYQTPAAMPTNMELVLGPIESQELVANQFMFGLYFVDNTGAGVGWSLYYDGNAYLWNLAGYAYSSTSNALGGVGGTPFRVGLPYFLRLRKAGTNYFGSMSYGTRQWSSETSAQPFSTATRIGFGRMFTSSAGHRVSVGRFTTI